MSNLFEVVETVDAGRLCGWELWKNVKQLQYHILLIVDDSQVESPEGRREVAYEAF